MGATNQFITARDQLLSWREDANGATREFRWPQFEHFNWALDYFDAIAAGNESIALRVVDDSGRDESLSFSALSARSSQVANFLRAQGIGAGDRVLVMLGNIVPLWETMLACIQLRRRHHSGDDTARARRPARPPRPRQGEGHRDALASGRSIRRARWRSDTDRGRRDRSRLDLMVSDSNQRASSSRRRARRAPTICCCCISPPAPRRARSSSRTPT